MDVLPISLGLETADGKFEVVHLRYVLKINLNQFGTLSLEVILPRNSHIPVEVTMWFHTFEEGQQGITVEVSFSQIVIVQRWKYVLDSPDF